MHIVTASLHKFWDGVVRKIAAHAIKECDLISGCFFEQEIFTNLKCLGFLIS
jgi:hypothetical protein